MASRFTRRVVLPLLMLPGVCLAQKYVPPPPPLTVDPCTVKANPNIPAAVDPKAKPVVCLPPAPATAPANSNATPDAKPSAAEEFPFPGSAPAPAAPAPANGGKPASTADQFPFPGSEGSAAAPAAKAPAANAPLPAANTPLPAAPKTGSAADQFPYPGETSKSPDAVPEGDTPRYVPDSPAPGAKPAPGGDSSSSSSSSSSDSSSSSSGDPLPTAADEPDKRAAGGADDDAAPARKGRRPLPKVSALSPDERVTEDLNVAKFYSGRGNYQAAYLRSKDATKVMPEDAESHFALAEAAQKLQKKDEAVAEYTLYLKLDPGGDKTAAAQKALSVLR